MRNNFFKNLGFASATIGPEAFKQIQDECFDCYHNEIMVSGLSGKGVAHHYYLDKSEGVVQTFASNMAKYYEKSFNYLATQKINENIPELVAGRPWINIQKKHEYMPNHTHDGLLSYVIWVKIPYEVENELDESGKNYSSCFEFTYNNIIGTIATDKLLIRKEHEGTILMFPSKLQHCVYPFYSSDDVRISISGNIFFKSKE